MRKIFTALFILCCFRVLPLVAQLPESEVSKDEAFRIVQGMFSGQNPDYYFCEHPVRKATTEDGRWELFAYESDIWYFFIDPDPMKGWEHDCYVVRVPKIVPLGRKPLPQKTSLRLPPDQNFTPLRVTNRYGHNVNHKPFVIRKSDLLNGDQSAANRTYAIILSGGGNKNSNHERYWNDCSFIYQTLTKQYSIPKDHIYPIMSDGTDPAEDMKTDDGYYKTSPLDLDEDGSSDIQAAATRTEVRRILNDLSQKMQKDDHLFFYVIDHGGTNDHHNSSYICLWNGESLNDYELAEWLRPFNDKSIYVNAVLGQCYSGGFVQELNKVGCVVATASAGNEYSWSCRDIPYDEFVYHWTSAVNGFDAFGRKIFSDTDENHRVTMKEAFDYAIDHDRATEKPQYSSKPQSTGDDLAFNNIPQAVDLYVKDNPEDTGKEPNLTTTVFWKSPSICVRNKDDGIYEHENPYYSDSHRVAHVYVRVYNRGKEDYDGTDQWLHVYWAKASTGLTIKAWKGEELYKNRYVTGGPLRAELIGKIPAGGSRVVKVDWLLPSNILDQVDPTDKDKHHFCLFANITNTHKEPRYDLEETMFDIKGNNNFAQKNVSIVRRTELSKGVSVFVRNIYGDDHRYTLELRTPTEKDNLLFSKANVRMEMASPIYDAWKRGGLRSVDVDYTPSVTPYSVRLKSPSSRLEQVCMHGAEFEKVNLNFDFYAPSYFSNESYTLDLIQRDENGEIVGGETFIVQPPLASLRPVVPIIIDPIDWQKGTVKLSAEVDGDNSSFRWTNENGEELGAGRSIKVRPLLTENHYYVTALSKEGELSQGEITLEVQRGIKSVTPTADKESLNVEFFSPVQSSNAVLQISSLTQGGTYLLSKPVALQARTTQIDISPLTSGVYVITYSLNGEVVDSKKFNK